MMMVIKIMDRGTVGPHSPDAGGYVDIVGVGGHLVHEGLHLSWGQAVQQVLQIHLVYKYRRL